MNTLKNKDFSYPIPYQNLTFKNPILKIHVQATIKDLKRIVSSFKPEKAKSNGER
jgi:hypothetical protein